MSVRAAAAGPIAQQAPANQNLLHFRPISTRLGNIVIYITAELYRVSSPNRWHGTIVRIFAIVFRTIAAFYLLQAAAIETAVTFSIGIIGVILSALTRSEFLKKYATKALAQGINASYETVSWFFLLILFRAALELEFRGNRQFLRPYHISSTLINHGTYLASAVVATMIANSMWKKPNNHMDETVTHFLKEDFPSLNREYANAYRRDLRVEAEPLDNTNLDTFFERNPVLRDLVNNLSFRNIIRLRALQLQLFQEIGIIRADAPNAAVFEVNRHERYEVAYQTHLHNLVKPAIIELYDTPELVACLAKDKEGQTEAQAIESGRDQLSSSMTFLQIAAYSQFKELDSVNDFQCPKAFRSPDLVQFNERPADRIESRYQLLTQARTNLRGLTEEEKKRLVKCLLKADSSTLADGSVSKQLYRTINTLAAQIHPGKLMARVVYNPNAAAMHIVENEDRFLKACQASINQINARPAVV